MNRRPLLLASLGLLVAGCNSGGDDSTSGPPAPGPPVPGGPGTGGTGGSTETLDALPLAPGAVIDLDGTIPELFTDVFTRYSAVEVPTGRLHILVQSGIEDRRVCRAREVLRQGILPVAGTSQGSNKDDVAIAMVDGKAILAIFRDAAAIDLADPEVSAFLTEFESSVVALPATHIIAEGTAGYMQASPQIDATFGAAAVLIHRAGLLPARSSFANELSGISAAAITSGLFTPPALLPAAEHPSAYLALAMDVHSGVFGHDPDGDGHARSGGASYGLIEREELGTGDAAMKAWIEAFFPTDHTFAVELPSSFSGTFDCLRRSWNPYSSRSEHLRNITLTGSNSAELFGAPFDLVLKGNAANNNLKGRRGFDTIDGGDGFDTAVFSFPFSNYEVRYEGTTVIVEDVLGGHEQTDTLTGIERLQFSDQGFNL